MQDCDVSEVDVRQAINRFLASLYDKKTEKEQKQLDAALEKNALDEISVLQNTLADAKAKYSLDTWMKDAAERMAQQLKFGTHISKGVHPDSKGDNVNFKPRHALPDGLVGSQSIHAALLDANGNAAALPLASFFDYPINAENPQLKIRHLIEQGHPALKLVLASSPEQSTSYFQAFQAALNSQINTPASHERNKQLLWPIQDTSHYHTVIPLYPSVLTHQLFQALNQLRYSESNKQARDNRFKKNVAEQQAYVSIRDLATVQLGGTKPQNISQLTSRQSGRNYLLPSLPPRFKQEYLVQLKHSDTSMFNASLAHYCREPIGGLFEVVPETNRRLAIRDKRKAAIDEILFLVVLVAEQVQQRPAGWTTDEKCHLDYVEKQWLDPQRAELEGQAEFKTDRETYEWRQEIIQRFANWLNNLLKKRFKQKDADFGKPEHQEWQREIESEIKRTEREGKEVFQ